MSSLIGPRRFVTVDGNEAAAYVAHKLSEVIAIYPITPSSTMGEFADQWSSEHQSNIWGSVPHVIEMQSEGGAAGAAHGALPDLADGVLHADQSTPTGIFDQRQRVDGLKRRFAPDESAAARDLVSLADVLVKRSVWIVGGDGWAYDIGYGGLDHVLASGRNVNMLVLDTEVYSNTGGQMSKSTPRGAVAKFAAAGKHLPKKDLGLLAIGYGNIYAGRIAMGASGDALPTADEQEAARALGVRVARVASWVSLGRTQWERNRAPNT